MTRTGRVLPGSVPCGGFRSASQTSPRLSTGIALDGRELGVDLHAFIAHALGDFGQAFGAKAGRGLTIHPANRHPDVFGAGDAKRVGRSEEHTSELQSLR